MSALFSQAARQDRERFFWRIDSQWGKGLRQKTKSDRCPDFRVVTRPPIMHCFLVQWREKNGHNSPWQTVFTSMGKRAADDYIAAYLTLWPGLKLRVVDITPRSKQTGVQTLPSTLEVKAHCDAQTLVTRYAKTVRDSDPNSGLHFLRPGDNRPSASSLVPDMSGFETLIPEESRPEISALDIILEAL